jgi:hypothetical protein
MTGTQSADRLNGSQRHERFGLGTGDRICAGTDGTIPARSGGGVSLISGSGDGMWFHRGTPVGKSGLETKSNNLKPIACSWTIAEVRTCRNTGRVRSVEGGKTFKRNDRRV